jgi:hypothetical protein
MPGSGNYSLLSSSTVPQVLNLLRAMISRDSAVYDATAMIPQQLGLSFDRNAVYECGAALLVVLACPNENVSEERRANLHASLCGRALWTAHLANRDDTAAINVKPPYVFRDIQTIDRDTKFVDKRFQERLVAGRMAVPFLQKAELGRLPRLPPAIKRLSINQMAEFVSDDAGQSDANNVERRTWATSRRVIHLAAAAAVVRQELGKRQIHFGLEQLLTCRETIAEIIRRAQLFEDLITKSPTFPVPASDLVQVRLI